MKRFLAAALIGLAALAAAPARADPQYPTPWPNVNAPGHVILCPTSNGPYVPCGSPGALPLPVVVTPGQTPWFTQQVPLAFASYRAVAFGNTAYATPTDLACLQNPATSTKTVYVTQFASLPQQTTSALQTFYFLKRTTLNTGGTSAAATSVAFDSADPAATASLLTYTGAPTAGTSAGALNQALVAVVATTQAPTLIGLFFESGGAGTNVNIPIAAAQPNSNTLTQPITLRAGEELCINFNGAALPSGFTAGYIAEWAER